MPEPLRVAKSGVELYLLPQYTNHHGAVLR